MADSVHAVFVLIIAVFWTVYIHVLPLNNELLYGKMHLSTNTVIYYRKFLVHCNNIGSPYRFNVSELANLRVAVSRTGQRSSFIVLYYSRSFFLLHTHIQKVTWSLLLRCTFECMISEVVILNFYFLIIFICITMWYFINCAKIWMSPVTQVWVAMYMLVCCFSMQWL